MGRPSRSPRAALALATIALVLLTCAPRPALASPSSGDATDLRLLDDATSRAAASSGVAPPAPLATTTTGAADAPPPPGKPGFEKTLAAQVDNMLAKEFKDADASANAGVLGEGAGKSFNRTVIAEGATLETVARVRRAGGGHELEREGGSGGGGGDGVGGSGHDASGGGGGAGVGGGGSGGSGGSGGAGAGSKFNAGGDGELELPRDHVSAGAFIERTIRDALHTGAEEEDVERLVDAKDNEFVISNPKSGTMELQQDLRLIRDLVVVLVAAAIGAVAFTMMGQPLITGYLVAGAAVGPGGLGLVVELVQVETLAQFGIIFLLFTLGVEFSYAKLKHVQGVALGGGLAEIALMMLVCGVVSNFTGAELKEGVFVGAFLSMSSTAVCVKCLAERKALSQSLPGQITVGTLVLQDCTVGLLFALLPVLGGAGGLGEGVLSFVKVATTLALFLAAATAASKTVVARAFRFISPRGGELYQMVTVAFCLVVAWTSEWLGLSIELGAFVAGVMASATPFTEQTLHAVEPVKNVFTALFLASIGMIMNPYFLWLHLDVLLGTLLVVTVFKCAMMTLVVRSFGYTTRTSLTVGISLAQVGEFSFVLLSRASALGLVQRNMYLLLLGTTALSLIATPLMFRLTPAALKLAHAAKWIEHEGAEEAVEMVGWSEIGAGGPGRSRSRSRSPDPARP